ncbi:MAG: alternate ATPase, subunit gamma [Myxococcaceae bacterium]|nr:alternate ATPase, subunit gamma [Myxococcaceae bacterium]
MSDNSSLSRKLASAGDLQSVVRTMKALAASSIGQYERSVLALADYTRTVELGLAACLARNESAPGLEVRIGASKVRDRRAVVFGSDQGLVGKFNETIADYALQALAGVVEPVRVWTVGERVQQRLCDSGLTPAGSFVVPASVSAIGPLVGQILLECAREPKHGVGVELRLFYNRPCIGASYESRSLCLLPLDAAWRRALLSQPWPSRSLPDVMGQEGTCLRALLREHLFISLFRACAESLASENASRLAAMERADKNIGELLGTLEQQSQRSRQNGIDEELFDVVSGFEALTGR